MVVTHSPSTIPHCSCALVTPQGGSPAYSAPHLLAASSRLLVARWLVNLRVLERGRLFVFDATLADLSAILTELVGCGENAISLNAGLPDGCAWNSGALLLTLLLLLGSKEYRISLALGLGNLASHGSLFLAIEEGSLVFIELLLGQKLVVSSWCTKELVDRLWRDGFGVAVLFAMNANNL